MKTEANEAYFDFQQVIYVCAACSWQAADSDTPFFGIPELPTKCPVCNGQLRAELSDSSDQAAGAF